MKEDRYTQPMILPDGTKAKLFTSPYSVEEAQNILASGNTREIVDAIWSLTCYCDAYELGLEACKNFYKHAEPSVRGAATYGLANLLRVHGRIDIELAIGILKVNLKDSDTFVIENAHDTLASLLMTLPKQRKAIREIIEKDIPLGKRYDYLFIPKRILAENRKKIRQREQELTFCCDEMTASIKEHKIITYEMTDRSYGICFNKRFIKMLDFCPWCGVQLPMHLNSKIFEVIEKEYGLSLGEADIFNCSNIPDEFLTDAWWRKRGL